MFPFRLNLETLIGQPYTPKKDPAQSHVVLKTQEYAVWGMAFNLSRRQMPCSTKSTKVWIAKS